MNAPLTAWGVVHVTDMLKCAPDMVREVLVEERTGRKQREFVKALEGSGVSWRFADREELVRRGGPDARSALATMKPFEYVALEQLVGRCPERCLLLAVDSVTDPGNFGAIVRSAVFFGAAGLVVPERNSVGVTPAVVRRSAGAVAHASIARVVNLARSLRSLKDAGFWIYGTMPGGGTPVWEEEFPERTCVVLGSEGKGIRPLVAKQCDAGLSLAGHYESLNVASFASVLLYEWNKQTVVLKKP